MLDVFKPAIETAVRHGATALATFLVASAFHLPAASTILTAAGLNPGSLTSIIIGGCMGAFGIAWSYSKNVQFIKK